MKKKIYAYKNGSASAKALAEALGCKRLFHNGRGVQKNVAVINWGASRIEREFGEQRIINSPTAVKLAANKVTAFQMLSEGCVKSVPYTTDKLVALGWLSWGYKVVCRHLISAHSGNGIEIIDRGVSLPDVPLYTRLMPKKAEWRVHVVDGQPVHIQRKARNLSVPDEEVNWSVRNLAGGFIFAHLTETPPEGLSQLGVDAVKAMGLDFGAVDILETPMGKLMVLEVNTAPGLEGTTLTKYVEAFNKI
jgi:hypothetical protein